MSSTGVYTGISDFLHDRASYLRVMAVETEHGIDIVLRLDGSYASTEDVFATFRDKELAEALGTPEGMADYFREQLEPLLIDMGIEPRRLTDWNVQTEQ